jgi:Domain of unknown function (DUF4388)
MLRGSLDDFSLEDIFWLVARAGQTGELVVDRPGASGRFFFAQGRLYSAESELMRESFGERLARSDAAERGMVFRQMVEDTTFELLRRELGEFYWNADITTEPEESASFAIDEVLAAAADRRRELDEIRSIIPTDEAVVAISSSLPDGVTEVTVSREQWRLLAFVDGRRSIQAIGSSALLTDFQVLRTLFPIAQRGLLEVSEPGVTRLDVADAASTALS